MKNFFLLILAFLSLNSSAQEIWQRFYKDAYINDFAYSLDNEFVMCGYGFEQDTAIVQVFRTDSLGNVTWSSVMKFTETIRYTHIISLPDTGFLFSVTGDQVLIFYKYNKNNELEWEKRLEIESRYLRNVQMYWEEESNSCFFVVNDCDPICSVFIGKMSSAGELIWIREHESGDMLACVSAVLYSENDFYLLMSTDDGSVLYKTNGEGQKWWSKSLELEFYNKPADMMINPEGNLQMLFNTSPSEQIVLLETDLRGNIFGQREYSEDLAYVLAASACRTVINGTAIFGSMETPGISGVQNYILNLDSNGDSLWVYHPEPLGIPAGIVCCSDGNLAFLTTNGGRPPRLTKIQSDWLMTSVDQPQKDINAGANALPNPFSNQTCFYIDLEVASAASSIQIYDLQGREICDIPINGRTQVHWNACDNDGLKVKAGLYLYRISNGIQNTPFKKMVIIN